MADAPLVEVDGLTFRYRRASEPAIRDVSLRIDPGEVLLVAGPSGCGKSTLIRALNGLIPHAYSGDLTGSVRVDGRPTTELRLREVSQVIGTLLQDPAKQIVGSTVESELAFGPENVAMPPAAIAERIGEVFVETGIAHLAGRETAFLSGGEQQLLAMAGALMLRPRCYVIDEPLANLDPATANGLLTLLRRLADAGHAVIIVEHRVEEALALRPDRILAMDDGRVSYLGTVAGFLAQADPVAVKLPFHVVLARMRELPRRDAVKPPRPTNGSRTSAPTARLEFDDVHVTLGERHVLRGVDATFGAAETIAVLGPNGSGKTTLFRTAMQLVAPDHGTVRIDGRDAAGRPIAELAQSIGYVFQSPSQMLFARTVREELLFGPRNLGLPLDDPDALAMEALRRTGLDTEEDILDRPPLTLSFGQQKRLALGLALRPATLILDEPSAGQDHRTAAAFMRAVAEIPGLDSVYFVTHDVDLALTHSDRILVVRDGRIVADGPPASVVEDAERWAACNLERTSLMEANLAWSDRSDRRFLDAPALAAAMLAVEHRTTGAGEGGLSVER